MGIKLSALVLCVLCIFYCASSVGHKRIESYSVWHVVENDSGQALVSGDVSIPRHVARISIDGSEATVSRELQKEIESLKWQVDEKTCQLEPLSATRLAPKAKGDAYFYPLKFVCPEGGVLRFNAAALFPYIDGHKHITHYSINGQRRAAILGDEKVELVIPLRNASETIELAWDFVIHGFDHVIAGWDHILFVIILALSITSLLRLLCLLTMFTMGHLLSLAFVLLSSFTLKSSIIELGIGFSVAYTAARAIPLATKFDSNMLWFLLTSCLATALWVFVSASDIAAVQFMVGLSLFLWCYNGRSRQLPEGARDQSTHNSWLITFVFGLIHGLGLAGALSDLSLGKEQLLKAIVLFNFGVEIAQLLILLCTLAFIALARQRIAYAKLKFAIAAPIYFIACYWWFSRL